MMKMSGRKIKKLVGQILSSENRKDALHQLSSIPGKKLAGPLFSYFYSLDDTIRFRSTVAMGELAKRLAKDKIEESRKLLRRIMWNLNDESGGIGWGSVEAMGEILKQNKILAKEFEPILFSYIIPGCNFLEHEMLQRGSLWGVGTYLKVRSTPDRAVIQAIIPFLDSDDPVKTGYSVRALINMDNKNINLLPPHILSDQSNIPLFDGWNLYTDSISEIAGQHYRY